MSSTTDEQVPVMTSHYVTVHARAVVRHVMLLEYSLDH